MKYTTPELEICVLGIEDVLTASGDIIMPPHILTPTSDESDAVYYDIIRSERKRRRNPLSFGRQGLFGTADKGFSAVQNVSFINSFEKG